MAVLELCPGLILPCILYECNNNPTYCHFIKCLLYQVPRCQLVQMISFILYKHKRPVLLLCGEWGSQLLLSISMWLVSKKPMSTSGPSSSLTVFLTSFLIALESYTKWLMSLCFPKFHSVLVFSKNHAHFYFYPQCWAWYVIKELCHDKAWEYTKGLLNHLFHQLPVQLQFLLQFFRGQWNFYPDAATKFPNSLAHVISPE